VSRFGLGETSEWYRLYAVPEEVYVFRARVTGVEMTHPDDALALLAAVGRASDLNLNVQGITVNRTATDTTIDVPMTTAMTRAYAPLLYEDADGIATAMLMDAQLRSRFPKIGVSTPELLQLTGPPAAIDFWRSHATLWDTTLGQGGQGGPTAAFAERAGVYHGVADGAPVLKPWTVERPGLGPAPSKDVTALWVMGGLVLAWLVIRTF
jgi:hypothetical protein